MKAMKFFDFLLLALLLAYLSNEYLSIGKLLNIFKLQSFPICGSECAALDPFIFMASHVHLGKLYCICVCV